MKCLTVGDLFSGIGGFALGLERAGMRTIWFAEIEPYACAVLAKHWPSVPNYGDVRFIRAGTVERPDVVCGGFPCQDISRAGKRRGIGGDRSRLWSEFARIVGDLRPRFAVVENVGAITVRGLATVCGDLAALGYDAEWHAIPASAVGANHQRDRVYIIASDAAGGGMEGDGADWFQVAFAPSIAALLGCNDAGKNWQVGTAKPAIRGMDDGISRRMDRHRLRCLGNAVVPQVAEIIGRVIVARA